MNRRAGKKAHGDKKGGLYECQRTHVQGGESRGSISLDQRQWMLLSMIPPWSVEKAKESPSLIFNTREDAINFMDELLKHKMFHRAKKIPVPEKTKKINNKRTTNLKKKKLSNRLNQEQI
ncbi:SEC62 [Lepeophtheirus salmonis]|uniref:SEC62 n=1 Tax=Lepeophtheirus salmonis TaxID=72036 RepID=A0A7R8CPX7_LEPSM|nr:SEC62 [Lepeophtheirus salmonis]CAF2843397.1 SEC62 [Lepeophtheirus salmonis]